MEQDELYFGAAVQYYVTGRFAVLSGLAPVAGNLLHYAVEMALKGHLARKLSATGLKDHKHSLTRLWRSFKASLPAADLKKHDAVIARLDQFESIRYPELIAKRGAQVLICPGAAKQSRSRRKLPQRTPRYVVYLADIDALLDAIFAAASVNPKFFTAGFNREAKKYLAEYNATQLAGRR